MGKETNGLRRVRMFDEKRVENFLYGEVNDDDLLYFLRRYTTMWKTLLKTDVVLGFKDGEIVIETIPGVVLFKPKPISKILSEPTVNEGDKADCYWLINKLEKEFQKLTPNEFEVLFWRLIDTSTILNSEGQRRSPSNSELAAFLEIPRKTLTDRLYRGYEKIGGHKDILERFICNKLEKLNNKIAIRQVL